MLPKNDNFSFISTPITAGQLKEAWPLFRLVPDFLIKPSIENLPPFKMSHIRGIRSKRGREIEGYLIICPILRRPLNGPDEPYILEKIIAAGRLAERMRSAILGLSGYGSLLSPQAYDQLNQSLKIPATSGNALTAWTVIEILYRVATTRKINLEGSSLFISGSDSCVGRLCSAELANFGLLVREKEGRAALKKADIVINASVSEKELIDIEDLKPGAIFCDVSLFSLADKAKLRDDITVIEGGLIKLPSGQIFSAAMAEVMLLALEERFTAYSGVESINPDKLEEIADLAAWHGFEVCLPSGIA